jgi:hypothetical protein
MSYAGANEAAALATLTATMVARAERGETGARVIANDIGSKADAETCNGDRIVWVPVEPPNGIQLFPPDEQPEDADGNALGLAIAEKRISFRVHCYGSDFETANALGDELCASLYEAFTEGGADWTGNGGGMVEATAASGLFLRVQPVTLNVPVFAETYRVGIASGNEATGSVYARDLAEDGEAI